MFTAINLTKSGPVATLELARPKKMNALSDELLIEMQKALDNVETDGTTRALIITGQGRAFCAGFDLSPREEPFTTVQDWRAHGKLGNDTWWKIWRSRLPIIAAVNGFAMGGGCDLSMICDYTIAAESAQFGAPEIQFQSTTPFNITPWIIGLKAAKEFMLFGDKISAAEAQRLGIVNRVVPDGMLAEEATKLAFRLAKLPPSAVELNKVSLNRSFEVRGLHAAIEASADLFTQMLMTQSPEATEFVERVTRDGLSAALKWRDELFRPDDVAASRSN